MSKALVVGGNSGIGLAMVLNLLERGYEFIYIVGKDAPRTEDIPNVPQVWFLFLRFPYN